MNIETDFGPIKIDFDPKKYKTKASAAKAFHKALCKFCKEVYGQNTDIEVFIDTPEESQERGYGKNWRVCWESGPYEWAIGVSMQLHNCSSGWYTEPHYSFDLCFTS